MAKRDSQTPLSKREKFEQAGRLSGKKIAIACLAVVLVAGGVIGYVIATKAPAAGSVVVEKGGVDYSKVGTSGTEQSGTDTSASPASGGATPDGADGVQMVRLSDPVVGDTTVEVSLSEIKTKRIGGLLYSRTNPMPAGYDDLPGQGLPVLAYISPSGRLVVATSLCEPCHSYNFHIEGKDLVCNACFTHWNLDTLEGVNGGCTTYPPQVMKTTVQGDKVLLDKIVLESWKPRI